MGERLADPECAQAPGCENGYHARPCPYAPVPIAPDPERDKRVAARRAADAARAGEALDKLLAPRHVRSRLESYRAGWDDGYAASEEHHNGHYDVSLPTDGYCGRVGTCPGVARCVSSACE